MGNIATSFNEQIKRLEERGMELDFTQEKIIEIC